MPATHFADGRRDRCDGRLDGRRTPSSSSPNWAPAFAGVDWEGYGVDWEGYGVDWEGYEVDSVRWLFERDRRPADQRWRRSTMAPIEGGAIGRGTFGDTARFG